MLCRYPNKASNVVDSLVDVLYKSSSTSPNLASYSIIRNGSIEALCTILKAQACSSVLLLSFPLSLSLTLSLSLCPSLPLSLSPAVPLTLSDCHSQQMSRTEGDIRLVNSVFTTLYTPFYLAHKKYVKHLGQTGSLRYLTSPHTHLQNDNFGLTAF